MTRIENVTNVIEYYDAEVALRICKHAGCYYIMYLDGEQTKLFSTSSLVTLKRTIEYHARSRMTTIFKGEWRKWVIEWRILRIWSDVLSEIMNLEEIEEFETAMNELEKIKEIPK